jgi:hypothetical protein
MLLYRLWLQHPGRGLLCIFARHPLRMYSMWGSSPPREILFVNSLFVQLYTGLLIDRTLHTWLFLIISMKEEYMKIQSRDRNEFFRKLLFFCLYLCKPACLLLRQCAYAETTFVFASQLWLAKTTTNVTYFLVLSVRATRSKYRKRTSNSSREPCTVGVQDNGVDPGFWYIIFLHGHHSY